MRGSRVVAEGAVDRHVVANFQSVFGKRGIDGAVTAEGVVAEQLAQLGNRAGAAGGIDAGAEFIESVHAHDVAFGVDFIMKPGANKSSEGSARKGCWCPGRDRRRRRN